MLQGNDNIDNCESTRTEETACSDGNLSRREIDGDKDPYNRGQETCEESTDEVENMASEWGFTNRSTVATFLKAQKRISAAARSQRTRRKMENPQYRFDCYSYLLNSEIECNDAYVF